MPSDINDRLAMARRHVATGDTVIIQQKQLIEAKRATNFDTAAAEDLLSQFEQLQAVFEDDLERLVLEHSRGGA